MPTSYIPTMESALVVLVIVVALVAIDAIGRLDERKRPPVQKDSSTPTTQKIVVDLTGRDRD